MKQLYFLIPFAYALANPQEPQVLSGEASIHLHSPEVLEIAAADRTLIEWREFNIAQGETARFLQPSAESLVVNRVLDANPSILMGQLEANGQVVLINHNGILVGKEAQINTGSFIASTLDMIHFEKFTGKSKSAIENFGNIRTHSGDILLIGGEVNNEGSLESAGLAGLISGSEVDLKPTGMKGIYVRGNSFSDLFTHKASHKGDIKSQSACVLGDQVFLTRGSLIDVSGDFGGGEAFIGGGGASNPNIASALRTRVEAGAKIDASARMNGNAGRVIIWGNEETSFHGDVLAQGGALGGNGGFVEVSGAILDFQGTVSASAPIGKTGTLLIDPVDIAIQAGGAAAACGINTPLGNTIFDNTLLSALLAGCSVTIQSSGGVGGSGNITVNAPVTWAGGTLLTLDSFNNITINPGASIQETGAAATGGVVLIAPDTGTIAINGTSALPTYVGSANGITAVGDPNIAACLRTHPNLSIDGAGAAIGSDTGAQLGFRGATATGPIDVTCGNLSMTIRNSSVCIGHGTEGAVLNINAPITVAASGTVTLQALSGLLFPNTPYAAIGHGGFDFTGLGSNLRGSITVSAGGNVLLINSTQDNLIRLGHGRCDNFPMGGAVSLMQGDISITSGGSVTLNTVFRGTISVIGHYSAAVSPTLTQGNIYISAVNDVNLIGVSFSIISHLCNSASLGTVSSEVNVVAGRDITISLLPAAAAQAVGFIGARVVTPAALTGDVKVFAGRDINLQNRGTAALGAVIGHMSTIIADGNSNTFVGVGRNLNFLNPITSPSVIRAPGNVNVGVSGNIISATTSQTSFISTMNTIPLSSAGGAATCIWAGGNITGTSNTFFGSPTGAGQSSSIDIRAGGTIVYPNNFNTSQGFFNMAAPTLFQPGQLWTTASGPSRLATACTQGNAIALTLNNCFSNVITLSNSPINTPSATSVLPAVTITTTSGPITLSSPLTFANGNTQASIDPTVMLTPCSSCTNSAGNLVLGPGSTQISTTSGNITIGTFQDITINQSVSTSGNIDITACRDLNANNTISTTAAGTIHLSGTNVNIAGAVSSQSGSICLNSTQTMNILENIASTAGGAISAIGETLFISSVITTSGPIMLISQDMNLLAPATISSTGSTVTLVVDRNNPAPPLPANIALLGALNMAAGTAVSSGIGFPLSVFTAQQNLNTILGTLNGVSFSAGTLFVDTTSEIWCAYAPPLIGCSSCLFQMGCNTNCPSFPFFSNGVPFTVYYKNCLQLALAQAQQSIVELNVNLHPYNEYPGWSSLFFFVYREGEDPAASLKDEPYFLRRRHLNHINHPKTWTLLLPE